MSTTANIEQQRLIPWKDAARICGYKTRNGFVSFATRVGITACPYKPGSYDRNQIEAKLDELSGLNKGSSNKVDTWFESEAK